MLFVSAAEASCAGMIDQIARNAVIAYFIEKTSNARSASARPRREKRRTSNFKNIREQALNDPEFEVERGAWSIEC